ncbi:MAG: Trans-2,3-dihydro-3-hydroxyanthranilate isomerase [Chroococcopsis gigantea SAG 12.99]|jgi:trans-2,3-dihydro-3-hydroxyanthranilate isomerase|nr:Trans-2,3-dihydro-3-hydroxyanthranilate isomerase [Chroococcopsis gigantea SAG 12.99]
MQYRYYTADVFTDSIFGGNPLSVFPEASNLTPQQMQKVAAEFNFSETVFVLPPETPTGTKRLRIFTPTTELPFAGHPTIGTAYVLGSISDADLLDKSTVYFEEGVGLVPVTIRYRDGKPCYTELTAPQLPVFGHESPSLEEIASILSLKTEDLMTDRYAPQAVSCGLPFLFVPIRDGSAFQNIKFDRTAWQKYLSHSAASSIYVFCFEPELENSDIHARMFAPALGVTEDPATGSAASALAGYLSARHPLEDGCLQWIIEQGFYMGRPSILTIEADKENNEIKAIRVGGTSILVCQGWMEIPDLGIQLGG